MSRLDSLTPASSLVRVIPSMSHRFPLAPFPARSIETRSLPSFDSCAPAQFYLDHSHHPVLAPATLAVRRLPDR